MPYACYAGTFRRGSWWDKGQRTGSDCRLVENTRGVYSRRPICGMGMSAPSTVSEGGMDGERIIGVGVLVGVIFIVVPIRVVGVRF